MLWSHVMWLGFLPTTHHLAFLLRSIQHTWIDVKEDNTLGTVMINVIYLEHCQYNPE